MVTREYDENGFVIKPAHDGKHGPPLGQTIWVIERHDGKLIGPFATRHDAVGYEALLHDCDDYELHPIPAGSLRFNDVHPPRS